MKMYKSVDDENLAESSMKEMLTSAIQSACRDNLPFANEIQFEGLIGITVDKTQTVLVHVKHALKIVADCSVANESREVCSVIDAESESDISSYDNQDSVQCLHDSGIAMRSPSITSPVSAPSRKRKLFRSYTNSKINEKEVRHQNEISSCKVSAVPDFKVSEIKEERQDIEDWTSSLNNYDAVQMVNSGDALAANMMYDPKMNNSLNSNCSLAGNSSSAPVVAAQDGCLAIDQHIPSTLPPTARKLHPAKRCRVCYRNGLRKETRVVCLQCTGQPGLCAMPCFALYHLQQLGLTDLQSDDKHVAAWSQVIQEQLESVEREHVGMPGSKRCGVLSRHSDVEKPGCQYDNNKFEIHNELSSVNEFGNNINERQERFGETWPVTSADKSIHCQDMKNRLPSAQTKPT